MQHEWPPVSRTLDVKVGRVYGCHHEMLSGFHGSVLSDSIHYLIWVAENRGGGGGRAYPNPEDFGGVRKQFRPRSRSGTGFRAWP